ncbi:hypothetical protein K7X08_016061 [Anisodus acutangulus]|uniref:Uncharacterized protein n=1 Tax=Anisodus acutangulus TaxID=402998 RepID=A0A9Q1LCN2_9SOLA|nr:hypothetical protein K7X08_016061 [Anisodus acutangulus]
MVCQLHRNAAGYYFLPVNPNSGNDLTLMYKKFRSCGYADDLQEHKDFTNAAVSQGKQLQHIQQDIGSLVFIYGSSAAVLQLAARAYTDGVTAGVFLENNQVSVATYTYSLHKTGHVES